MTEYKQQQVNHNAKAEAEQPDTDQVTEVSAETQEVLDEADCCLAEIEAVLHDDDDRHPELDSGKDWIAVAAALLEPDMRVWPAPYSTGETERAQALEAYEDAYYGKGSRERNLAIWRAQYGHLGLTNCCGEPL